MSEIKNYILNFGFGRDACLTSAVPKLACAEIEPRRRHAAPTGFGEVR